jgi:hypothetical protein
MALPTLHQSMISQMLRLVETFSARVEDRSTLDELHQMIGDDSSWIRAHDLFDCIRRKTLDADRRNERAVAQYDFEEVCAKTLYNLTDTDAPFDEDAPYWVVPAALSLARRLGIDEAEITNIVAG